MPNEPRTGIQTVAIHADREHNPTNAVAPPIFQTTTFRWDSPDDGVEFASQQEPTEFYSRWGNPNTRQLEAIVAKLEGAHGALATASGMAAATLSIVPWLSAGDHVVAARTLYGETAAMLTRVLPRFGVTFTVVPSTDPADYARALRPETKLVVTETPANPTLDCVDLAAVAAITRAHGARLVVDNTFATPVNTRPIELGAHTVFHSATKYLGGHGDVVAGVMASDEEGIARAWSHLRTFGAVLDPFGAWLVTRGLRTLGLRMERHNANGLRVAEYLAAHPRVTHVNHPFLAGHPSREVAMRQMKGGGAMVSFEIEGGVAAAKALCAKVELFTLATSLGGVESLVMFPSVLSRMSPEAQRAAGVSPSLVRLSIGCEDVDDLLADLGQALAP